MPYIHNITYPEKTIEENVNFFADYFVFLTEKSGDIDLFYIDNSLSLCENMLFQIETNFENCPEYLKSILSYSIFTTDVEYLFNYKNYHLVKNGFEFIRNNSSKQIKRWLNTNSIFINELRLFQKELKKKLFTNSLTRIIELLKKVNNVKANRNEIKYHTSVIFSELTFKGYDKKQLNEIFNSIVINGDKVGFNNQFLRFKEIYNEKPVNDYLFFKIDGLKIEKDLLFKYNQVTFASSQNKKFDLIKKKWKQEFFYKDFFGENSSIAFLKYKFFSKEIAGKNACKIVLKELAYLNQKLTINAVVNPFIFLHSPTFKISPGFRWMRGESGFIKKHEFERIEASPFNKLKGCNKDFCDQFLKHEDLYSEAIQLDSPHIYWHYLEALLNSIQKKTNQNIIEIISKIVLLKYKEDNLWEYLKHLFNIIVNDHTNTSKLLEYRYKYSEYLKSNNQLPIDEIESLTQHPFINYIIEEIRKIETSQNYSTAKNDLVRIIMDIKAQRNAIVHNGLSNSKRLLSISNKTSSLINRFREILIKTAQDHKELNFLEVFELLIEKSENLIQS